MEIRIAKTLIPADVFFVKKTREQENRTMMYKQICRMLDHMVDTILSHRPDDLRSILYAALLDMKYSGAIRDFSVAVGEEHLVIVPYPVHGEGQALVYRLG